MKRFATILLPAFGCLANWLFVFSTPAQTLPGLNVNASNRTIVITWPYTNSGFAFQEATNLTATAWQASALYPGFDSNSATFSVSAATTNSAKFFRLTLPADLRGIYVYVPLGGGPDNPADVAVTNAIDLPGMDGMLIVGLWSDIETNYNQYDWSHLDKWMNYAVTQNKKVNLDIRAGDGIPAWLFLPPTNGPGATQLTFAISPKDGKTGICQTDIIAIPWEPGFLNSWNAMLTNLSVHLKSAGTYSNVTLLRLTGINRTSDELRLPAETPDTNIYTGTGMDCVSNAPAIWQSNAYTPSKLLFAWSNIVSSFDASFPDKSFSVAIIPYPPQVPFPPIDDNGQLITTNLPDQNQPLLQLAGQMLPGRLVVQFNFLMTSNAANPAVIAAAQNYGSLTAYQVNNWFAAITGIDSSACGGTVTNPAACDDASYLNMLEQGIYPLGPTNGLRSQYIEVWATNAVVFTNAIWQAHQELFAPP
ncbi:MAG TPA: hypothetical protein VN784_14035 [Candidatus Limnocylindrales bacterium]|nr:hypothetical protein [Candidatus Limnocylindrales bacterium]